MLRLTREVRFAIRPDGTLPPDGRNGFAGRPGLDGLGFHFILRITLSGEVDTKSSYLRNIVDIDHEARARAIPVLQEAVRAESIDANTILRLRHSLERVESEWNLERVELSLSPTLLWASHTSEPDMVRLSQKFEFSAAHRLHNPALSDDDNRQTFGKCNNPFGHGHNYEVQVTLRAPASESFPPIAELEQIVDQHAIEPLDHKHLNLEVPEFRKLNPSVENIARVIFTRLRPHLKGLASVTVWETPKTSAEYSEPELSDFSSEI